MPLRGCTSLKTPPKEIVRRGFTAIFGFLRRLQMGAVTCKRTKLMLVGLGGAGKTRFVIVLVSDVARNVTFVGRRRADKTGFIVLVRVDGSGNKSLWASWYYIVIYLNMLIFL